MASCLLSSPRIHSPPDSLMRRTSFRKVSANRVFQQAAKRGFPISFFYSTAIAQDVGSSVLPQSAEITESADGFHRTFIVLREARRTAGRKSRQCKRQARIEAGILAGFIFSFARAPGEDRKSVVLGKRVDLGGRRIIKKERKIAGKGVR